MNPNNVKDDVFIIFVMLVRVAEPVGALYMQLDIANPLRVVDFYRGFQKVRSLMQVPLTGMNDVQRFAR